MYEYEDCIPKDGFSSSKEEENESKREEEEEEDPNDPYSSIPRPNTNDKASVAAYKMKKIYPCFSFSFFFTKMNDSSFSFKKVLESRGEVLSIPMPGHSGFLFSFFPFF